MTSPKLRNRKGEAEKADVIAEKDPTSKTNKSSETDAAAVDTMVVEPNEKLSLVPWVKREFIQRKSPYVFNHWTLQILAVTNLHNFTNDTTYFQLSHSSSPDSFYINVFYPVWKHLDDRGFGGAQSFICWLLIPFTLSMIVWYYSVVQLIEMGNWEATIEPLPEFPEDFTWGEL